MLSEAQFNTWIEALESDKYKQGKSVLRFGDTYCCLGVLADTLGSVWTDSIDLKREPFQYCNIPEEDQSISFLPNNILNRELQYPLSSMNDNGKTFKDIVKYLREHKNAYVSTV